MQHIPEPLLLKMAGGITVIQEGRVYKPSQRGNSDSSYIVMGDSCSRLVELGTLLKLEELYREFDKAAIDSWKDNFLKTSGAGKTRTQELEMLEQENMILDVIVRAIMPYFVDESSTFEKETQPQQGFYVPPVKQEGEALDDALHRILATHIKPAIAKKREEERKKGPKVAPYDKTKSVLENILGDVIFFDDVLVYDLIKSRTTDDVRVVIGKNTFYLSAQKLFSDLRERYIGELERIFGEEACENDPRYYQAVTKCSELMARLNSPAVKNSPFSIEKEDYRGYYVCLAFSEFANIGEDGRYYRFPSGRVGVKIWLEKNSLLYDYPVVMENYYSPFVYGGGSAKGKICLAGYHTPHSGKQAVIDLLHKARNVIISGYSEFGERMRPNHRLEAGNFSSFIVDEEEARKIGVTNEQYYSRRR